MHGPRGKEKLATYFALFAGRPKEPYEDDNPVRIDPKEARSGSFYMSK
jgi:hypothetical protein